MEAIIATFSQDGRTIVRDVPARLTTVRSGRMCQLIGVVTLPAAVELFHGCYYDVQIADGRSGQVLVTGFSIGSGGLPEARFRVNGILKR